MGRMEGAGGASGHATPPIRVATNMKPQQQHLSPEQAVNNYKALLIETTRKSLAIRREFPGCFLRWKRAAPKDSNSPNRDLAVVFFKKPGQAPVCSILSYSEVEALAASVTDTQVFAELDRRAALAEDEL